MSRRGVDDVVWCCVVSVVAAAAAENARPTSKKKKKLTDRRIQKERNEFFAHAITVAGLGFYSAKEIIQNMRDRVHDATWKTIKNLH